jgi:hypothetical protein
MRRFSTHSAPWTPLQVHHPDLGDPRTWHQVVVVLEHGWTGPGWVVVDLSGHGSSIHDEGVDETSSLWSCGYLDPAALE